MLKHLKLKCIDFELRLKCHLLFYACSDFKTIKKQDEEEIFKRTLDILSLELSHNNISRTRTRKTHFDHFVRIDANIQLIQVAFRMHDAVNVLTTL